ncbi:MULTISPECIES: alkaline shock response membrane anchor protein AmaP [Enterococcus]|uniref:Alkaline shock response membrane anchor protein AmaP n=1 Tax=Candidatus Enterococcus mangumiae TaxID=2230878 RepID=A0ABZ2SZF4_9ENTE|nr:MULTISPECIES: alkaline shock response membrane anchor protein AmaP [unclassified Enterococcus]MBO0462165.1 alkaline shock response membrane anchor protein AmaP [Enterococcus sp. DIV1298c]MBO0489528.1 alkaline shock response membrane anchor protein AmaP [Enterococcus sp. DIV1094]MBO1301371.1 alkaline shock response membrane anchor protein AmaP [Enterococcus sp. DIV1271a]
MNKGVKIIGVIVSIVLLSVLLIIALVNAPYVLPEQLERFRFFTITNYYMQQYIFWAAVVFAIVVVLILLFVLFYPKSKGTFVLKHKDGKLTLDKKAIEGLTRSYLHEEEFIQSPKVKVRSTKQKINIHVKGDLKRTSSLIGKTEMLMQEVRDQVANVLGSEQEIKVAVNYSSYQEEKDQEDNQHSRVE